MAALCPGVKYGLSSQQNFGENKDLIFLKLTDSAFRAIEDYLKNQIKYNNRNPTIKFLGNEGQLSFPSSHNGGYTSFNFSMSSTADMEGPGGSFECVQQSGPSQGALELLGTIPHKIRIFAKDDVYETTRQRMTVAEENQKKKSTREIKPNQGDIGRKVKVKQTNRPSFIPARRESPVQRETSSKPSYQLNNLPPKPVTTQSATNGLSNGLGNNNNNSNNNNNNVNHLNNSRPLHNKPSMSDIAKRPIRERLIHLLALRPFKKPELFERLNREGVRERSSMSSVLKQVASLKDNCYHLNRALWNEVNDDWPFYSETEKQMLKRRKPQNLTPPGGSDGGSSASGHSPTSTHPDSPPPPITSSKRPGYYDGADGLPTKRQRISHYRKPSEPTYRAPIESNNSQRRPVTDSRDASNMNPRSRESPTTNGFHHNNNNNNHHHGSSNGYADGSMNANKRHSSDEEEAAARKRVCDSHSLNHGVNYENTFSKDSNSSRSLSPAKNFDRNRNNHKDEIDSSSTNNSRTSNNDVIYNGSGRYKDDCDEREQKWNKITSNSYNNNKMPQTSPNNVHRSETNNAADSDLPQLPDDDGKESKSAFPDYLTEYTTIKDINQRRKYKADFNAHYAEYRELHGIVEKVSRRFAELEERLKQEDTSSPKYKDIKKLIVKEYQHNKRDKEHQKAKERFQYLHEKLSHIKRLVLEYDQAMVDNQY